MQMNQSALYSTFHAMSTIANLPRPAYNIVASTPIMIHVAFSWDPGENSQDQDKEQEELQHLNDYMQ